MGYRLYRRHRYHFYTEPVFDGLQPAGLVIEVTEIVLDEVDDPEERNGDLFRVDFYFNGALDPARGSQ